MSFVDRSLGTSGQLTRSDENMRKNEDGRSKCVFAKIYTSQQYKVRLGSHVNARPTCSGENMIKNEGERSKCVFTKLLEVLSNYIKVREQM